MKRLTVLLVALTPVFAQRPDPGPSPRPDPAREAALARIIPVTTGEREDDHPAIAAGDKEVWIAWVSYSDSEHAAHIYARAFRAGRWGEAFRVTDAAGDYHKPAIAVTKEGGVWVVAPAQVRGNWDLYGRYRNPAGAWSAMQRLTADPAPDFAPVLASSSDRIMLVWQSMRRNQHDLMFRIWDGDWSPEGFVTESAANDWAPALAAAPDGTFYVAWDSFRGDYDVLFKAYRNGRWGEELAVAAGPQLENQATITADSRNRVWIAWEIGPEQWAADSANGGLRARRDIGLACLDNGKLYRVPAPDGGKDGLQQPTLIAGGGGVRLFVRQPMNRNWLSVKTSVWAGSQWAPFETLPYSEGRIDQRVVAAEAGNGSLLAVYPAGSSHNIIYSRLFEPAAAAPPLLPMEKPAPRSAPERPAPHRFRNYQLVWGDLHRHTDISEDGGIIDGSLADAMRYALDAAGLDFIGITDHTRYLPRRYNLYRIQQVSDLFYKPQAFSPLHAYERSQYSPWGHRNVLYRTRDHTPVPAAYDIGDPGVSPWGLFEALRPQKALSIPHTSAWGNKQVSWDYYDPQVERLVEIYQGLRSTYEYLGAPDPADRQVYEKDSKNFVWDALARGRKLGFIASSDHRSTHMSFAAVYVKRLDRESLFEALQARRTYAATDKILLEFSIGDAVMGEEIRASGPIEMAVAITATAPVARIDIIKNGAFAYTAEPKTRTVKFSYRDHSFDGKESYYYVRVIQQDKQMAWSSPIWVKQ